jgi:perosamine synthetase
MELAIFGGKPVCNDESKLYCRWPHVKLKDYFSLWLNLYKREFSGRGSKTVKKFEEEFARYNHSKYAVSINSGTSAIHASLCALGVEQNDEVITSAFSFIASALPITYCGAKPVFVDIDPRTFNIDPKKIEEKITERTKALVVVHFQGLPADMNAIVDICNRHELSLIEDCAQATGARYNGINVGNFGEFGAFSIMSEKQLATCGEGGVITCNDLDLENLVNKTRMYGEHFDERGNRSYHSDSLGYNFVFNPIQASFAINRLRDFPRDLRRIRSNAEMLSDFLEDIPFIDPPYVDDKSEHVYHLYRIKVCPEKVGLDISAFQLTCAIAEVIDAEGLSVRRYQTVPLPGQKIFEKLGVCDEEDFLRYENTLDVIKTTLVIGGNGSAPHYFYSQKMTQKYIEVFQKINDNINEILEYAKNKDYPFPWEITRGVSDTKSGKFLE